MFLACLLFQCSCYSLVASVPMFPCSQTVSSMCAFPSAPGQWCSLECLLFPACSWCFQCVCLLFPVLLVLSMHLQFLVFTVCHAACCSQCFSALFLACLCIPSFLGVPVCLCSYRACVPAFPRLPCSVSGQES